MRVPILYIIQLFCKHDRITNERDYVRCIDCHKILVPSQSSMLDKIVNHILGDDNSPRVGF